jgi:hypothetical protein
MSTDHSPAWDITDPEQRQRLRDEVDDWFIEHGVPQFADRYSPTHRLQFLVLPLAVLVAFEVGAAPKLPSTLLPLLIVPPVLVALGALARPFVGWLLGREEEPALKQTLQLHLKRLVGLVLAIVALSILLSWSNWPRPWSDAWVDFAVILLAEFASVVVFTKDVWRGKLTRPHAWLIASTIGAVILFAFLLTLDEGALIDSRQLLNNLAPGDNVPLASPALLCMAIILTLADRVSRRAKSTDDDDDDDAAGSALLAACFPAVPLLVLVFAAQTTLLREAHALAWVRVWLPLGSIVALFALSAAWAKLPSSTWWKPSSAAPWRLVTAARRRLPSHWRETRTDASESGQAAWDRIFGNAGHPLFLAPLLAASLIGYPMRVPSDLGVEVLGWSVGGGAVAALMFGIYVLLVWFYVWFGLDRVAVWVGREILRDLVQIIQGVAGGLPMLLVFAAFFALTAETWQVVVETDRAKFISLIGLLVGLTLGVLIVLAIQQLGDAQRQLQAAKPDAAEPEPAGSEVADPAAGHPEADQQPDDMQRKVWEKRWNNVRRQARRREPSDHHTTDAVGKLFNAKPSEPTDLSPKLERRMKINALLVIGVYQALVLVPVGIGALLLFWAIGRLAVTETVAAQWVYGDNALTDPKIRGLEKIEGLPFFGEPWTRVPLVLAAFSVLYLTVSLLTNREQRTYFFSAASAALQQRLAVRIAYRLRLCDPDTAAERHCGWLTRLWRARPWHGRRSADGLSSVDIPQDSGPGTSPLGQLGPVGGATAAAAGGQLLRGWDLVDVDTVVEEVGEGQQPTVG